MIAVAIQFRLAQSEEGSERMLAERARALSGTAGLVSCCLRCPARPGGAYRLVTCWDSLGALDRWLSAPAPAGACAGCPALPAAAEVVTLDIVDVVAPRARGPLLGDCIALDSPAGWG